MYTLGHIGAALLVYAPVAALLTAVGEPHLAASGTATAVGVSTLPDIDHNLQITHRGGTHTVWFALACGVAGALVGAVVATSALPSLVLGTACLLSICSHLLADSITPMGIAPFAPLSRWHCTLDIVPSKSRRANIAMLLSGVAAAGGPQAVLLA